MRIDAQKFLYSSQLWRKPSELPVSGSGLWEDTALHPNNLGGGRAAIARIRKPMAALTARELARAAHLADKMAWVAMAGRPEATLASQASPGEVVRCENWSANLFCALFSGVFKIP
jgi:hypothetical protein